MNTQNNYYVYGLVNPIDQQTFYIGKGHNDRMKQHVSIARNDSRDTKKNPHLYNKIKKILNSGHTDINYEILGNELTETDAFALEAAYIEYYSDTLCNISKGGIQSNPWQGKTRSESDKQKIRDGVLRNKLAIDKSNECNARRYGYANYTVMKLYQQLKQLDKQRLNELNAYIKSINTVQCRLDREKMQMESLNELKRMQTLIDINGCRTENHAVKVLNKSSCYVYGRIAKGDIKLYSGEPTTLEIQYQIQSKQNVIDAAINRWKR